MLLGQAGSECREWDDCLCDRLRRGTFESASVIGQAALKIGTFPTTLLSGADRSEMFCIYEERCVLDAHGFREAFGLLVYGRQMERREDCV